MYRTSAISRPSPDEGDFHQMIALGQSAAALDAIAQARRDFPSWRPSARLLTAVKTAANRQRVERLIAPGNENKFWDMYRSDPTTLGCHNLPAGRNAVGVLTTQHSAPAERLAKRLLACQGDADRIATLETIRPWMSEASLLKWIDELLARDSTNQDRLLRLRYAVEADQVVIAQKNGNTAEVLRRFPSLADRIKHNQDSGLALSGAWAYLNDKDFITADTWFQQVRDWAPNHPEALLGAALCAQSQYRFDDVVALANQLPPDRPERPRLLQDAVLGKAKQSYEAQRYDEAAASLTQAGEYGALPRHARAMQAWTRLALGQLEASANGFAELYREQADNEAAEGTLLALTRMGRETELDAPTTTEPLASLRRRQRADHAFNEKRFLQAKALAPETYDNAGAIGTPSITLFTGYRNKSGTPGTSQLHLDESPSVSLTWGSKAIGAWQLDISRVTVNVGGFPPIPGRTIQNTGHQPNLSWRDDATNAHWEAELGTTPTGADIHSTFTGMLAHNWDQSGSHSRLELHRTPVKESGLSYVGNGVSGQVLRDGVLARTRVGLGGRWSTSFQAQYDHLTGHQVASNHHIAYDASVGYALPLRNFDFAVLSMGLSTDHYAHNLSQFTEGHGGYFSPQRYWRAGPSFDYMTAENRDYMLRGRVSIGRSGKQENDSAVFPLADAGQRYQGSNETGIARDFELGGTWRLDSRLQTGAWVSFRHSPQYDDRAALFFVRVLFEPRSAVLSTDLPNSHGAKLY